jgi:aspartyl-tRNA(Asn)/glutamyl-tRNA(Gln) amidotransferase subunit C
MSLINSKITQKVALLARLSNNDLSEEEKQKYADQLEAILEYVVQLNQIDTGDIQTTDGWRTNIIDDLREDEPDQDNETYDRTRQNIIVNFPHKQGDLLSIPGIFEGQ